MVVYTLTAGYASFGNTFAAPRPPEYQVLVVSLLKAAWITAVC